MSVEQKLCEVKIFQLQSMSNAIKCIDQRFAFKLWYIISGLDIQPKQSENDNPVCKKEVPGCEIQQVVNSFFFLRLIQTHGSVVE